eukprot:CAMPEP_0181183652 /NCGR_PEP_ID=MMETSP1096-20121128/8540_1 /TAXON_ID=156174 ORGANISM="Chrysochromulina ericina, Strain CCMP281" /NCGR_SAMPLE_ID=MMETSP1096 /ASSEMBLY_ACC=CAM_ASM_000453 /LENGTH=52 /DNA_ID=CAMNT_0023272347 /DNA_START=477 /DNA_END=632 /DNA_ORIENTATION=-
MIDDKGGPIRDHLLQSTQPSLGERARGAVGRSRLTEYVAGGHAIKEVVGDSL